MSTFLELCQDVAQESGTIPGGGTPAAVTGQTGRRALVVSWVRGAYMDIQRLHDSWRWLEADFSGSILATVQTYNASSLGITRFGDWKREQTTGLNMFTIYLTADGIETETPVQLKEWDVFRREYLTGAPTSQTGKPIYISVDPAGALRLWPTPDDSYTLRGVYWKSPQTLAANGDTPEMPSQFHEAIKWLALVKLALYDEAPQVAQNYLLQARPLIDALKRHQLPRVTTAGPLA